MSFLNYLLAKKLATPTYHEYQLSRKVLSIQSHVVHGHVGNTSATFPLQLLGYEVDVINSVQFSNHTSKWKLQSDHVRYRLAQYDVSKGQVLGSSEMQELVSGLRANGLLCYTHLLTGYIGSLAFLNEVYELICELKQNNPDLIYGLYSRDDINHQRVCDPVMGDDGKMYVPQELLPIYQEKVTGIADILTPNQYEAELLSGVRIKSKEDAMKVLDILLAKGTKHVVITSVELGESDTLTLFAGSAKGERMKISFPKFSAPFTGTGDLFSALLLGWSKEGLKIACEKAICTMHAVLQRTLQRASELSRGREPSCAEIELKLVQSKRDIEEPPSTDGKIVSENISLYD